MENKHVGFLVLGIAVMLVGIILLFQGALLEIVETSCSMEEEFCPMYNTINQQTYLALAIVGVLVVVALILIFAKVKEKIVIRKVKEKKKRIDTSKLDKNESLLVGLLSKENGAMFQNTLMEKIGIGKVGITRLLDKLEAKQIIERKRRGMNNIVVLKD